MIGGWGPRGRNRSNRSGALPAGREYCQIKEVVSREAVRVTARGISALTVRTKEKVMTNTAPPRLPFVLGATAWILIVAVLVVLIGLVLLYV